MDVSVWKSLDEKFDSEKFLYHYTNVTKVIKILNSKKLIFSPLTFMNDTSEYKARITVDRKTINDSNKKEAYEDLEYVLNYCNQHAKDIRLLCFSQDVTFQQYDHSNIPHWDDYERFFDLKGRGCALPRMWAQYASNNEGVCLIFDKNKLLEAVNKVTDYSKADSVIYEDYFYSYQLSVEDLRSLKTKIKQDSKGVLPIANLFKTEAEFIKYNYFVKLKDWQNENEYRILALASNDEELAIDNIFNYLVGVVVGEKNDIAFTNVIKLLLDGKVDIKKIVFDNLICKFKEC